MPKVRALYSALRHRASMSRATHAHRAPTDDTQSDIKVAVVAEQPLYGQVIASALTSHGLGAISVVADGLVANETIRAADPDVVLLDLPLPEGVALCRWCAKAVPKARVVTLSMPTTEQDVLRWAAAGLAGYLPAGGSFEALIQTVRRVATGEPVYSLEVVGGVFSDASATPPARAARGLPQRLTFRELEVVRLIDQGLSNKEIAQHLSIQVSTVKNHVHNILEKLNVHRRAEAAAVVRTGPLGAGSEGAQI